MMMLIALMHGCSAGGRGKTLPTFAHVDLWIACLVAGAMTTPIAAAS